MSNVHFLTRNDKYWINVVRNLFFLNKKLTFSSKIKIQIDHTDNKLFFYSKNLKFTFSNKNDKNRL